MKARPALPEDIKELMRLVRAGKLFAVQKWIAEGKPTMPPKPYWFSPLRVAIETGFHSMIELLVKQGVDAEERDYMLNRAVWNGDFEVIKLLVEYGADIHSVDFADVCRTGHPFIIQFFLDHGIDAETDQPFAQALRNPKRIFLRIYMRNRDKIPSFKRQLNLALRHLAWEGNLKWVSLLMWAGGDPHLHLPDIGEKPCPRTDTSALEEAVNADRNEIVEKIGIDPKRDHVNGMFEHACLLGHTKMAEKLLAVGANPKGENDSGKPMDRAFTRLEWDMGGWDRIWSEMRAKPALDFIIRLASLGARWNPSPHEIRRIRRVLYHLDAQFTDDLVRSFILHHVCDPEVLLGLVTAPKMKAFLGPRRAELLRQLKPEPNQTTSDERSSPRKKRPHRQAASVATPQSKSGLIN